MFALFRLGFALIFVVLMAEAVPRENFKTCEQSSFCRRCRKVEPNKSAYEILPDTLAHDDSTLYAELYNKDTGIYYNFRLSALQRDLFRLHINEKNPLHPRYEVENSLQKQPQLAKLEIVESSADFVTVANGYNKATLLFNPFSLDLFSMNELVISANARGLMRFEHIRTKPEAKPQEPEQVEQADQGEQSEQTQQQDTNIEKVEPPASQFPGDGAENDPGAWEENFKSHHDAKPFGPEAVALDFSFPGAEHAYGIPEHADSFALKSTKQTDPYRLYNLDVFEYELNEKMSLYGAVPVLYAHGKKRTSGVFWHNAAETWIDILSNADNNVVEQIVNFVSGSEKEPQVNAHFMSESGVIDVFFLLGPEPMDAFQQFAMFVGTSNLPPIFSLGYHQSRWNYNDQQDVQQISDNYDKYNMPLDVIWLDIEYTDGKKYFTWDGRKFPDPLEMVQNLTTKGRKLVVIIDPHIKRDGGYFLHNDATNNGYYVKHRDGKDYEGWCWPGSSSYLDFFDPKVREYYNDLYEFDKFVGTTNDVHVWNDMNEPSVFNGPEVTMPKDLIHYGGWEHRDIHNLYGHMYIRTTYDALMKRSDHKLRPFILSRSFFAGSQRYAAVWTGDNTAEWGHLKVSYPMCLSLAVSGISFCGADVGGFFKDVQSELLIRWYQAGAWLPFFRAHGHIDTKRREPWTFNDDNVVDIIREALRLRYSFLPLWYTLFREHEINGLPVIRPIWAHFPSESAAFVIDDEILIGDSILVKPVTDAGATSITIYFPGAGKIAWYDVQTKQKYGEESQVTIPVTLHSIPVFQREGSIVPRKMRSRRSTVAMKHDPYTLVVIADNQGLAKGSLYIDDESNFDYRDGKYLYLKLKLEGLKLSCTNQQKSATYDTQSELERVEIINPPKGVTKALLRSKARGEVEVAANYDSQNGVLTLRKPAVNMSEDWTIDLIV